MVGAEKRLRGGRAIGVDRSGAPMGCRGVEPEESEAQTRTARFLTSLKRHFNLCAMRCQSARGPTSCGEWTQRTRNTARQRLNKLPHELVYIARCADKLCRRSDRLCWRSDKWCRCSDRSCRRSDRLCRRTDRLCRRSDKPCRRSDKLCRRSDKLCRRSDKLCRRSDKLCRRSDKLCRRSDKLRRRQMQ
jgi:hypothetical protein